MCAKIIEQKGKCSEAVSFGFCTLDYLWRTWKQFANSKANASIPKHELIQNKEAGFVRRSPPSLIKGQKSGKSTLVQQPVCAEASAGELYKSKEADIVRRSLLNSVTSVGISTTDEQPACAEALAKAGV